MDFAYCVGCSFLLLRATRLQQSWATWTLNIHASNAEDPWSISGASLPEEVDQPVPGTRSRPGIWRECCREGPMAVRSMMDRIIQPPHLHIRIKSTTYSSVYLQSIHMQVHADENGHCFTDAFLFEANVLHLNCN